MHSGYAAGWTIEEIGVPFPVGG